MAHEHEELPRTPIINGVNLLASVWMLLSPLFLHYPTLSARATNVMFAAAILLSSGLQILGLRTETWLAWLDAAFGAWILVSPWVVGFSPYLGNLIVGMMVLILSLISALAKTTAPRARL